VFDITSAHQPRINGDVVARTEFLSRLQNMDDRDEAIILHVRILTEGIDVPGITGVMIMNNQTLSSFLQTLGRATRLYSKDRDKLYNSSLGVNDFKRFVKPYAYVIVPVYGDLGADIRDNIAEMIYALRTFGFNPAEDVLIRESKGKIEPKPLEELNKKDTRAAKYMTSIIDIVHTVEAEEEANKVAIDKFRLKEEVKKTKFEQILEFFAA